MTRFINRLTTIDKAIIKMAFLLLCLFAVSMATAQEFERATTKGRGFNVDNGATTELTLTIEGKEYPIFKTAKGASYLKLHSPRTNNNYALWIGEATTKLFEGYKVRKSSTGKYFYIVVSTKTKNPYNVYLKVKV